VRGQQDEDRGGCQAGGERRRKKHVGGVDEQCARWVLEAVGRSPGVQQPTGNTDEQAADAKPLPECPMLGRLVQQPPLSGREADQKQCQRARRLEQQQHLKCAGQNGEPRVDDFRRAAAEPLLQLAGGRGDRRGVGNLRHKTEQRECCGEHDQDHHRDLSGDAR
jgi:hypothetical protein